MDISDFKLVGKKILFENNFIRLSERVYRLPSGKKAKFYFVEKDDPYSVVVPYEKGYFYMIKQYRPAIESVNLEFPMGGVKGKKKPLEIAKQELKEEAGIIASNWVELGSFYPAKGMFTQKGYIFLATFLEFADPEPEEGEFLELVKIKEDEFMERVEKGEIKGASSIVAYTFFQRYKKKMSFNGKVL